MTAYLLHIYCIYKHISGIFRAYFLHIWPIQSLYLHIFVHVFTYICIVFAYFFHMTAYFMHMNAFPAYFVHIYAYLCGSIPASLVAFCSCTILATPTATGSCALFIARKLMRICPGMATQGRSPDLPPPPPHRATTRPRPAAAAAASTARNSEPGPPPGPAAAAEAAHTAAAGFCWANHFFHPAANCSHAPSSSSLCSAAIAAYTSAQFSSVTAGTTFSLRLARIPWACLLLANGRYQNKLSTRLRKPWPISLTFLEVTPSLFRGEV